MTGKRSLMAKGNPKSELEARELDATHQLPESEGPGDDANASAGAGVSPAPDNALRDPKLQKLRAERDTLLDRLARLQAEFENARKRSAREQQEFREFAAADVIKNILPVLD